MSLITQAKKELAEDRKREEIENIKRMLVLIERKETELARLKTDLNKGNYDMVGVVAPCFPFASTYTGLNPTTSS